MAAHNTELIRQLNYAIATDMTMLHRTPGGSELTITSNRASPATATVQQSKAADWDAVDTVSTTEVNIREFGGQLRSAVNNRLRLTVTGWSMFRGANPAYTRAVGDARQSWLRPTRHSSSTRTR